MWKVVYAVRGARHEKVFDSEHMFKVFLNRLKHVDGAAIISKGVFHG